MRSEIPNTVVDDRTGRPLIGAHVTVKNLDDTAASVYASSTAPSPLPSNILTTGSDGGLTGWLEDGSYKFVVTHASISPRTEYVERLSAKGVLDALATKAVAADLTAEVNARTTAVSNEASARSAADTTLGNRATALESLADEFVNPSGGPVTGKHLKIVVNAFNEIDDLVIAP